MLMHAFHRKGVQWEEVNDLQKVALKVDVLYQTRIQKERFLDRLEDYESARGKYIIDSDLMKILPNTSIVMHPLPRVDEVHAPLHLHDCLDSIHAVNSSPCEFICVAPLEETRQIESIAAVGIGILHVVILVK